MTPRLLPPLTLIAADGSIRTAQYRISQMEHEIPHHKELAEDIRKQKLLQVDRLTHLKTQLETLILKREAAWQKHEEDVKRRRQEHAVATQIQAQFRGYLVRRRRDVEIARKMYGKQKGQKWRLTMQLGSLQRCIHDLAYVNIAEMKEESAAKIQRWWRKECHHRRRTIETLFTRLCKIRTLRMLKAQRKLARWMRRIMAAWRAKSTLAIDLDLCNMGDADSGTERLEELCAKHIQSFWRSHRARRRIRAVTIMKAPSSPKGLRGRKPATSAYRVTTVTPKSPSQGKVFSALTALTGTLSPNKSTTLRPSSFDPNAVGRRRRSTMAKVNVGKKIGTTLEKDSAGKGPKKRFFDTSYKEDISKVKERHRPAKVELEPCPVTHTVTHPLAHPLLDSDVLTANPHYLSLARSLFQ